MTPPHFCTQECDWYVTGGSRCMNSLDCGAEAGTFDTIITYRVSAHARTSYSQINTVLSSCRVEVKVQYYVTTLSYSWLTG